MAAVAAIRTGRSRSYSMDIVLLKFTTLVTFKTVQSASG